MKLIDLTREIVNDLPVYPGDHPTRLEQTKELEKDGYNNHVLELSMHTGTHIDAPMHMVESDRFISEIPLGALVAEGCVIDVRDQPIIEMKDEYKAQIPENGIVLLCTGLDQRFGTREYFEESPKVTEEFAHYLVEKKVRLLAVDAPSPDHYPFAVHQILLGNNILIAENLQGVDNLLGVGRFEVLALPLKVRADGSPARIIARVW